jgi:hypothetical protein
MATELDEQMARLQGHLDAELAKLKTRLRQESRAQFEQNVNLLKRQSAEHIARARQIYEEGMASAADIKNPTTKKVYEESIKKGLEITLGFQKKLLDDFIDRWKDEFL